MNTTICPNPDVLADYVLGRVSEADLTGIASHVEACPACQSQLETLDGLSDTVVTCLRRAAALDQPTPMTLCWKRSFPGLGRSHRSPARIRPITPTRQSFPARLASTS